MTNESERKTSPEQTAEAGETLEWMVHPVKRKPWISAAVSLFVVTVVAVVRMATDSHAFAVLAAIVMVASLAKFYFPTRYRLDEHKITVKTTTQTLTKEWSLYRSCYPDKNGILLSPFAQPSRLENFRGLYLMFAGNHESVTAFCRAHLGRIAVPKASPGRSNEAPS
jgi:hypothetical protein